MNIQLAKIKPVDNANSKEMTRCILARFGLLPRKKGAKIQVEDLLLELYEKKKSAYKEKKQSNAVMSVEEMAHFANISRQTMYDYLYRFLDLEILKKTTFLKNDKLIVGYELSSNNLENSFSKATKIIEEQLQNSMTLIKDLQNEIKKEKIKFTQSKNNNETNFEV